MLKRDVTIRAKAIFGENIVKEAYQDMSCFSTGKNIISNTSVEPQDCCPVYVEFTNSKMFKILSSEWGRVTAIDRSGL